MKRVLSAACRLMALAISLSIWTPVANAEFNGNLTSQVAEKDDVDASSAIAADILTSTSKFYGLLGSWEQNPSQAKAGDLTSLAVDLGKRLQGDSDRYGKFKVKELPINFAQAEKMAPGISSSLANMNHPPQNLSSASDVRDAYAQELKRAGDSLSSVKESDSVFETAVNVADQLDRLIWAGFYALTLYHTVSQ